MKKSKDCEKHIDKINKHIEKLNADNLKTFNKLQERIRQLENRNFPKIKLTHVNGKEVKDNE